MNIFRRFKDDNSGVAIIMATIISSVLLVFCLSLLMVSYTLYSSTNSQNMEFATKELAKSFAVQFENELLTNNQAGGIHDYLNKNIDAKKTKLDSWKPYEGKQNEAIDYRSFALTDGDGRLGSYDAVVNMYYESTSDGRDITLYVEISVKRGKSYYSIENQYFTSNLNDWQRR